MSDRDTGKILVDILRHLLHTALLLITLICDALVLIMVLRDGVEPHRRMALLLITLDLAVVGFMHWDKRARGE